MRFLHTIQNLFRAASRWNQRRRSIADLHSMPDYLLADIGIARHQIVEVVNNLPTKNRIENTVVPTRQPAIVNRPRTVAVSGA